jgi:pentapeptide MXKDX repeat protein
VAAVKNPAGGGKNPRLAKNFIRRVTNAAAAASIKTAARAACPNSPRRKTQMTSRLSLGLAAAALSLGLALAPAFAMDDMKKDDGMKKDTMSKDTMKKDTMSKDTMKKDDGMKKDGGMMKKN